MSHAFRNLIAFALLLSFGLFGEARPQAGGNRSIFGDLRVDESKVSGVKTISFEVILYSQGGMRLDHQWVGANGRYRFFVVTGIYYLAVEAEGIEVARLRVDMLSPLVTTMQRDIELEWRPKPGSEKKARPGVVSAADLYKRGAATEKLFSKAEEAIDKKDYHQAVLYLRQILELDPGDYQSWTELGTVYLIEQKSADAENAYLKAIQIQPAYLLALIDLGKLRLGLKKFDGAIDILTRAVKVRPDSADANYLLGESYLQIKKGSLAVGYLNEALKLDPIGMADAHLRLAALYHGAGMKDKAAQEYEQFLKKKPDYSDRKKLAQYIAENKKH
jgi:cytochrome c-type biogenesis protein CcmH/NrfG